MKKELEAYIEDLQLALDVLKNNVSNIVDMEEGLFNLMTRNLKEKASEVAWRALDGRNEE